MSLGRFRLPASIVLVLHSACYAPHCYGRQCIDAEEIQGQSTDVKTAEGEKDGYEVERCDLRDGYLVRGLGAFLFSDDCDPLTETCSRVTYHEFVTDVLGPGLPQESVWRVEHSPYSGDGCLSGQPYELPLVLMDDWREVDAVIDAVGNMLVWQDLAESTLIYLQGQPCSE